MAYLSCAKDNGYPLLLIFNLFLLKNIIFMFTGLSPFKGNRLEPLFMLQILNAIRHKPWFSQPSET